LSRIAAEVNFGSLPSFKLGVDTYDQDEVGLGPMMIQKNDGGSEGKWAGPLPVGLIRPMEYGVPIPAAYPWAMQWSPTIDWVFFADNAATAATRRIMMAVYDRSTASFSISGFITLTYPANTNHIIRAMRMTYETYSTGTVTVSGTAVTGAGGAAWSTSRLCVGSRIGFGSTDPTQITTWYEISAIGSDTGITLTTSAGTVAGGTAYVIEDLRCVTVTTNATTTNGGVYVTKGLKPEIFLPSGTTIPAATTVDSIRACYWLADASTVTNTVALGAGIEPKTDFINQNLWVLDTVANPILFKYNIRKALTLTAGKDTTCLIFKTGAGGALTGTASQANNGRVATLSHGPGSGLACMYFTTTTKVYRTVALSTITTGSTSWVADNMTEVPPGGTNTFGASSLINSIEYSSLLDKLIIPVNSTAAPFRSYITGYQTGAAQFDRFFGGDVRQFDQSTADSTVSPAPTYAGASFSVWSEGGICYIATLGITAPLNRVYAIPLSADWEYASATGACIVTPRIACPNIDKFHKVFLSHADVLGGSTGKNLGLQPEPVRVLYRTAGISDNSGGWTLLDQTGDMSSVAGAAYVQFRLEFRTMGYIGIPARVFNISVVYNDLSTDSHWQFSAEQSNGSTPCFAWRFATAYGTAVPALRVRLYDATSGGLLVNDTTSAPTGTFEKSTNDGSSYAGWTTGDKANDITYLRYTPASLGSGIKVRAVLTLA